MTYTSSVRRFITVMIVFSFSYLKGSAQTDSIQEMTIDDLKVAPIRIPALSEVGGTMFMTPDYKTGNILIAANKIVPDVPVKFNILSNAVMVQKDGQELKLESFYQVSYDETDAEGHLKHVRFRQGLPEVDNHNGNSVYLVVSEGPKVHLLKYITQKVEDAATLGDYSRKELVTTEQLYIYVPGGTIKKVKSAKKDLAEALPAMAAKIDEIVTSNNLKLKSESEISQLVETLNRP